MNEWFANFWIRVIKSMAHTPMGVKNAIGALLALVLWIAVPKRRHVILTNLKLCFPDKSEAQRRALAKSTYRKMARAALDHGVLWTGTLQEVRDMVQIDGLENILDEENRPLIIIAPHFVGLDAAGIALSSYVHGCSLYQKQANAAWDKAAREGRERFGHPMLIAKTGNNDLRPFIRAMKQDKMPFYYLPDMDHGRANSIFVPFFGVPAATLPMASRLARIAKAKVILCIAEMTDKGYVVHCSKPFENFPTGDYVADTLRVTQAYEAWIEKLPDQYLWTHRRFKTRPEGEPSVY